MAKYRIVQTKHEENSYEVQEKIYGLFWVTALGAGYLDTGSRGLERCQKYVAYRLERDKIKKQNPKNKVIAEY